MSENLKWRGIITQNEKLKQEMAIKAKEVSVDDGYLY